MSSSDQTKSLPSRGPSTGELERSSSQVRPKAGFTRFDYVNPDAPKGGTLLIDGAKINSPEVPAGIVEIVVSGGMFQRWMGTATLASDVTNVVNTSNLTRR